MAYCWGMYVNGIAVYGRDPLLTCDYARFLATDQNCPGMQLQDGGPPMTAATTAYGYPESGSSGKGLAYFPVFEQVFFWFVHGISDIPDPPDWRNCSSSGYHP